MARAESISEPSTPTGLTDETAADAVAAAPPWSVFTPVKRSAQDAVRRRDAIHRRLLAAADLLSTAAALLLGVIVVAGQAIADELVAKLEADPGIMVEFVQLDDVHERLDDPRKLAEVGAFLLEHQIHRVVLAGSLGDRNREDLLPVIGEIKRLGLR